MRGNAVVNFMKQGLNDKDFIDLCRLIVKNSTNETNT
jgi:hypothetical protein